MKETTAPKQPNNRIFIIVVISLSSLLLMCCACFFLSSIYRYTFATYDASTSNSVEENYFPEDNPLQTENSRIYLDPDIDEEAFDLADQFDENFTFQAVEDTVEADYLYEKYFIKSNLQAEYERLRSKFNRGIENPLIISISDDQSYFEELYGFDYHDELSYAGLSSYGEILFLIAPEKDYTKEGLQRAISHELVHSYQFDSVENGLYTYPLWFSEGTAEFFSLTKPNENYLRETSVNMDTLNKVDEALVSGDPDETLAAYNIANLFITYLSDTFGQDTLISLMLPYSQNPDFNLQFTQRYILQPSTSYQTWHESVYGNQTED